MNVEDIVIKEFGKKDRIEYYKKTFNIPKTRDVLITDYGEAMYGSFNSNYQIQCCKHYVELTIRGCDKMFIGWDWIAKVVDQSNEVYSQLSLW